ncbi:ABC transporter ATP-binding protein [Actinoalloteichus spitiensis]|uniref:ABC transporter ATP-binding protein n=1 Tax=Actinoalloteichus spitiensis TaxID=252394 RepID=UPI0003740A95|nr:ABC transporter ATP-binding protein [Actinoalloteichus spitiensis]
MRALPPGPDLAVEVRRLVKRYPGARRPAVEGLSFSVRRGEILGLLGPNGAGKTTTLGVLTTQVVPTAGDVLVAGQDVVRAPHLARARLAVVTQHNNLDRGLTVRQDLLRHAAYHGVPRAQRRERVDALLAEFGMTEHARSRPDLLSGGQQQRVKIARALVHDPDVLFVDEPATGLDPRSRRQVHGRLVELNGRGVTVVITTHDLREAARLCQRVAIIDHGRLVALDTPARLTGSDGDRFAFDLVVEPCRAVEPLVHALDGLPTVDAVERIGGGGAVRLRVRGHGSRTPALADAVAATRAGGYTVRDLATDPDTLEDAFLDLTGGGGAR